MARYEERESGDLIQEFERLIGNPKAKDPGCLKKSAIARALIAIEEDAEAFASEDVAGRVFRRGARHVQLEAVYGGRIDVAGDLRIACAAGLMTCGDVWAIEVLADHLADREAPVRKAAATNLGARGDPSAVLLLRLRARIGDDDADVLGEVLHALLSLDPGATDVVAAWLDDEDEIRAGEAALALGASREPEAFAALERAYGGTFDEERRRVLLAAIASHRSDEAQAFLRDLE